MDDRTLELLKQTAEHFIDNQKQAYLVGGSIRNLLLGDQNTDWDIATNGHAPTLARSLANKLGGHYAHFHDKADRVIIKHTPSHQHQDIILDISPLQGNTIEEDLHQRDFTINAIASPLTSVVTHLETGAPLQLIDPLNGHADIQAHRLKAVNNEVFQHDPLRMLRALRLAMRYSLHIDPNTETLIQRNAKLITCSAPERIHDELYTILTPNGAADRLHYLDQLGLLTALIPEFIPARGMPQPYPHHWDVLHHSIESVAALEQLAMSLQNDDSQSMVPLPDGQKDLSEIRNLLDEAEQQGIFQRATLTHLRMKLAALLHDIGKPPTYSTDENGNIHFYNHPQVGVPLVQQILTRLNASTQDRRLIQLVTAHHMRPGQLAQTEPVTIRAIRRYFVDLGPTGITVALFSLADHLATLGPQLKNNYLGSSWERHLALVRLLLAHYIRERNNLLPPRLLSPEELMRRLQIPPGPRVGQLLDAIAEAQAEGTISSKEEALWLAEEQLHHKE